MKRTSVRIFIILFTVMALFFLVLSFFDVYYGLTSKDFYLQHLNFINYIRMNFYQTGDLFPQFNMNMGLGQSMVTLYYHGLYNPFIMFSFLVPFISTELYFGLMIAFIFALTASCCYGLLGFYKLDYRIKLITTTLITFSGVLIFHSHYHPMFIYYLPFTFINFILIHRLVMKNKSVLFILSFALVFFMNFFFAPMVILVNSFYFIMLIKKRSDRKQKIIKYLIANIIGITIGFFVTIPQFIAFLNSSRASGYNNEPQFYHVNFHMLLQYIAEPYTLAVGIIALCALIYFLIKRQNKILFIMALFVFILSFIDVINYLLNAGQYVNYKQIIYLIPLISILIAHFLDEKTKLKQLLLLVVAIGSIIIILGSFIIDIDTVKYTLRYFQYVFIYNYPIIMISLIFILICLHYLVARSNILNYTKLKTIFVCVTISLVSFGLYSNFYQGKLFSPITNVECSKEVMQYTNELPINKVECINQSSPAYYTSIMNYEYLSFFKQNGEMNNYGYKRSVNTESFNNYFAQSVFSISDNSYDFIYGQTNDNLYNGSTTSVYEMYFYDTVEDTQNIKPIKEPDTIIDKLIINSYLEVPISKNDGMAVVSMDISEFCTDIIPEACYIEINGVRNSKQILDYNNLENNSNKFYFYINLAKVNNHLKISATTGNRVIKDIEIYYFSSEDLAKQKEVVEVNNLTIDYNNSYSFDINMPDSGYIITTLPYDNNFEVYVDGIKVVNEKVNEAFLGFKITNGHHEITISYTIKGFHLSLALLIIGICGVIALSFYERRKVVR